ncbi:MAG: hypothetical protein AAGG51_02845 [Cyanobacteria bacterium P01_G01_bin.54]
MTSLSAFRTTYPHCTLVSELVGVEHGQYLVRCSIEQAGLPVASGLSAAPSLETAEDQARDRALALLAQIGVPPLLAVSPNPPAHANNGVAFHPSVPSTPPNEPSLAKTPTDVAPAPPAMTAATTITAPPPSPEPESPPPISPPSAPITSTVSTAVPPSPESEPMSPALVPPDSAPSTVGAMPSSEQFGLDPLINPAEVAPTPTPKPPSSSPKVMPNGTIDFTDIIARTNLEMKRLGWTNEQGRSYLLQTYGKRSRQRLDDNELLEFLSYLESQPDP